MLGSATSRHLVEYWFWSETKFSWFSKDVRAWPSENVHFQDSERLKFGGSCSYTL